MFGEKLKLVKNLLKQMNYTNVVLSVILFMGSFLRIYRLNFKGLWLDELFTIIPAKSSTIAGVLANTPIYNISPPLDFIIVHFFLQFGNNDFIARLPSALFGILSIVLIFIVAKSLFGTKEGIISALLLSISPMHIWYSQEVRMYSLFVFLSLLSILFFYKAIVGDEKKMWYGFIISTTLNIYTHYFAFFMILIYFIFLCILIFKSKLCTTEQNLPSKTYKTTLLHFSYSILIVFLLFIPQLQTFVSHILTTGGLFSSGLPATMQFFKIIFFKMGGWSILSLLVYTGFFTYGLLQILKITHRNQIILLIIWLATPLIVAFILTYMRGPMVVERYFIFILPAFIIIISKGIVSLSYSINNWIQNFDHYRLNDYIFILIFTSLLVGVTFTGATIDNLYNFQNKGDKEIGLYLNEYTENDDLIIIFDPLLDYSSINYYYSGPAKISNVSKDVDSIRKLIKPPYINEYNKIWIIYSESTWITYPENNTKSVKTGDNNLSIWLASEYEIQKTGPMQNVFKLSDLDKIIITLLGIEGHENYKHTIIYSYDLTNKTKPE